MTTTIDTATLKRAVSAVKPVACKPTQTGIAALAGVHLRCDGAGLMVVTCTDLEVVASVSIPAQGDELEAVVSAKAFADAIPAGKGVTSITSQDGYLTLGFGPNRPTATLPTLNLEEWPRPRVAHLATTETSYPWAPIAEVLPAVSDDQARPILTGLFFQGSTRRVVATDSYRLHWADMGDGPELDGLVPARAFKLVGKAKAEVFGMVSDDKRATITAGAMTVTATLIQGDFPQYERIIPSDPPFALDLSAAGPFLAAAGKALRWTSEAVCFVVDGSVTGSGGGVVQELPVGATSPNNVAVGFNSRYLSEALADTDGIVHYTDALKPGLIVSPLGQRIVMPVRIT